MTYEKGKEMTVDELLSLLKQTEWGNLSGSPLKFKGKSLLRRHCGRRLLKFEGTETKGIIYAWGFITILACPKCGYIRYENVGYPVPITKKGNLFNLLKSKSLRAVHWMFFQAPNVKRLLGALFLFLSLLPL